MNFLVFDIGGTYTKYAVMDGEANILYKNKMPTVKDTQEHFVDMLVQIYEKEGKGIEGIAISSTGFIEAEIGMMHNAGTIFCVKELPIVEELKTRCNVKVSVENDAKAAALAELWKGSLSDCSNAMVLICGTAIGGAVICDRKIIRGYHRMAGEFSYLLTDAFDAENKDKTFAGSCGVPVLLRMVEERKRLQGGSVDGKKIFSLAASGDEDILSCIYEYARRIAVQIMNMQFVFDPERIAVGGGISEQPLFLQYIREELSRLREVYPHKVPQPEICNCTFYNDANLIGALYAHLMQKK